MNESISNQFHVRHELLMSLESSFDPFSVKNRVPHARASGNDMKEIRGEAGAR